MSERLLGIFPLPIVLFPGAPQLLHIFEPRYRQMLDDCLSGDRRFGVSYVDPDVEPDPAPRPGAVGCLAHVQAVRRLPDGRSNILCLGESRYALREYVESDRTYRVARVETVVDEPRTAAGLAALADTVRRAFKEVAIGTQALRGVRGPLTELPNDPMSLSMHIAAVLDLPPRSKQKLLELRSTRERLERLAGEIDRLKAQLSGQIQRGLATRRNGKRHAAPSASAEP